MKDLAHHLKQLNRRIIRSAHREEAEEEAWEEAEAMHAQEMAPPIKKTATKSTKLGKRKAAAAPKKRAAVANKLKTKQLKKQAKSQVTKARNKRAATPKTSEEKNRLMKKRVPIFDRNNEKPKMGARASKKKTPRIK
jgi:hypothetical protein